MDLEDIVLSEVSQTEKDKYLMISYVEFKKQNKRTKWKQTYRYKEKNGCLPEV